MMMWMPQLLLLPLSLLLSLMLSQLLSLLMCVVAATAADVAASKCCDCVYITLLMLRVLPTPSGQISTRNFRDICSNFTSTS